MAKCFKIYILLFFLPIFIFAQYDNIEFNHLSSYKGLDNSLIRGITQDDNGFMWFATQHGLYKYDGYKFTGYFHEPNNHNSLSNNWIMSLYKDKAGNLWSGTNGGGLNKFNPKTGKFTRYFHDEDKPNSLCSNYILFNSIYEDHKGDIWVGTQNGVSRIELSKSGSKYTENKFITYRHDPNDSNSLNHNWVWSIYEDADFNIWIGTNDGALHKFDRISEKIIRIVTPIRLKEKLGPNWNEIGGQPIVYIGNHPDDSNNILTIATKGYLYKYDYLSNEIINHYKELADLFKKSKTTIINYILIDQNRATWIATNNGCYIIPKGDNQIYHYNSRRNDPTSLSWNHIWLIHEDKKGIFWFGLLGGKIIDTYDPWLQIFKRHKINIDITRNEIFTLYDDSENEESLLWIGTGRNGLLKFNRNTNQTIKYMRNFHNYITSIHQSPFQSKYLWIGTIGDGLIRFNKQTGTYKNVSYQNNKIGRSGKSIIKNSKAEKIIISLLFDHAGQLWIGSLNGVFKFDTRTNKSTAFLHDPENINSISANDISALFESQHEKSVLWIGTRTGGLNKFDLKTGVFTRFQHNPDDSLSLNSNYVSSILEDKSGTLWVGTPVGLNRLNRTNNTFSHIMDKDRNLSSEIQSILEDKNGYLWLNTTRGFGRFDIQKNIFLKFREKFARWAFYKNESGEHIYGAGQDIISFFPEKIKYGNYIPLVVLTDFQIFNKPVNVGLPNQSVLQNPISETKEIKLTYDQSVFSFEFAALDYGDPEKNKYAYKMEGVDPDWVYTDASRRFATYTQLAPGEYTFRVRGSNNIGVWNEEGTSIKVIITPPWWKTNLAYTLYLLLIGLIIFATWRAQLRRIRINEQLKMEHFEAEKLREVDHLKSHFFANISHEFRTPLTLIKGPVKQLLEGNFIGNIKEQYKMILRNSDRLLGLINQILDLSKLESGGMKLKVSETNIVKYLKGLVLSFASLAERKKVSLKFDYGNKEISGYIDRDKLEKIVTNLISNAFKFTHEGGVVEVVISDHNPSRFPGHPSQEGNSKIPMSLSVAEGQGVGQSLAQITISNTGAGIPADQLDKIFDRFYQADDNYKNDSEGSGIGLALTKELVELCHGEISVQSETFGENGTGRQPLQSPPVGGSNHRRDPFNGEEAITTFTVTMPIAKECFKKDEIIEETETADRIPEAREQIPNDEENILVQPELENRSPASSLHSPLLLIVEDNPDVTSYICSFMENDFRLITAENGKIGLEKTVDKYPDLIISDVMMPEMDGFELCQKIKTDERVSHIPVILLTAKADLNSKIDGLEFGADDYINKPFESTELKVRSKNLIEQRKRLREKFARLTELQPNEIAVTSIDEDFLKRLMTVFENHIAEPDFNTEQCAKEIGMSRSSLNRKLQALTNHSTHDFIRTLRLKRAAQLLQKAAGSVAEVAYSVGFNNTSHFAKAFRQHFGQSPSDFANLNCSPQKPTD